MKLIGNIVNRSWTFEKSEDTTKCFYIGFKNNDGLPIYFDNLSFGISFIKDNKIIAEHKEPISGQNYLFSDQEIIHFFYIKELSLGQTYELSIWAENSNTRWEDRFFVTMPYPYKVYESFIWNSDIENWIAPIPYPEDGNIYDWNENKKEWNLRK